MREAFALQKLLTFYQQKYWCISDIDVWKFNETLTNDVVSFEQPDPNENTGLLCQLVFITICKLP